MWLFILFIVLSFFIPGGPLGAGFIFMILAPEIILIWLIIEYIREG